MVKYEKCLNILSVPDADPEIMLFLRDVIVFNLHEARHMSLGKRQSQEAITHKDIPAFTITCSTAITHERRRSYNLPEFKVNGKKIPYSSLEKRNIGDKIEIMDREATVVEWVGGSSGGRYKYFVIIE